MVAGSGLIAVAAPARLAHAETWSAHARSITAITRVYGSGQRLIAVAVEYDRTVSSEALSAEAFAVDGRSILRAYANTAPQPAPAGRDGRFVILELSPDDEAAALYVQVKRDVVIRPAKAAVAQVADIATDAEPLPGGGAASETDRVVNLVVDDFQQRTYAHSSGRTLAYNLFVPKDYAPDRAYPLVTFMHDAGTTSANPMMTLVQGLGAVVWADPAEQAKRPCFVLAPQFPEQFVNDQSEETGYLEVVIDLIKALTDEFNIDTRRLYATGQSGGGMLSIAMMIKHPDFFAASFLVACQWAPDLCKPLAGQTFWVVVSEGDLKAYPGQNAIMDVLSAEGARISRAVWNGRWTAADYDAAVAAIDADGAPIRYVALEKGTVVLPGQEDGGGPNHVNTWRIAYQIEGIRDWLFRQAR